MTAAAPLSDAARLAAIRASLGAIAPGQWSRAADAQGEFCETLGRKGERWMLARFDPGATAAEMDFCVGAPEHVRFLLLLIDRAVKRIKAISPLEGEMGGIPEGGNVGRDSAPLCPAGHLPLKGGDQPAAPSAPKNHAAEAAMLCASPAFMLFLHERHGLERPMTADRAAQKLRSVLGVVSRREINDVRRDAAGASIENPALAAWKELRRDFSVWKGRVVF